MKPRTTRRRGQAALEYSTLIWLGVLGLIVSGAPLWGDEGKGKSLLSALFEAYQNHLDSSAALLAMPLP